MDPYSSGERVFGPPRGTFDADWAATALRSLRPELDHATSVTLVSRAWELVRTQDLRGAALTDALHGLEPALAQAVSAVATETAELYLDRGAPATGDGDRGAPATGDGDRGAPSTGQDHERRP